MNNRSYTWVVSISGLFICSSIASFTALLNIYLNLVKLCFSWWFMWRYLLPSSCLNLLSLFPHQSKLIERALDLALSWFLYCVFTSFFIILSRPRCCSFLLLLLDALDLELCLDTSMNQDEWQSFPDLVHWHMKALFQVIAVGLGVIYLYMNWWEY